MNLQNYPGKLKRLSHAFSNTREKSVNKTTVYLAYFLCERIIKKIVHVNMRACDIVNAYTIHCHLTASCILSMTLSSMLSVLLPNVPH